MLFVRGEAAYAEVVDIGRNKREMKEVISFRE